MWAGNDEAGDVGQPRQFGMPAEASTEVGADDDQREPLTIGEAVLLACIWVLSAWAVIAVVATAVGRIRG